MAWSRKIWVEFGGWGAEPCEACGSAPAPYWWLDDGGLCTTVHAHIGCLKQAMEKRYEQIDWLTERYIVEFIAYDRGYPIEGVAHYEEAPQLEP